MTSNTFSHRITTATPFLSTPIAQQARGYLDPTLETALVVMDAVKSRDRPGYAEIAVDTGLHINTVRRVVRALDAGGYGWPHGRVQMAKRGRKAAK
jgi:hypothetical protein